LAVASNVSFVPENFKEAAKEFRGVIVRAEYGESPLGFEGRPDIARKPQLAIAIETPEYDKQQYEWYPPSNVRKTKPVSKTWRLMSVSSDGVIHGITLISFRQGLCFMEFPAGVSWAYFIEAMTKVGAMKDIKLEGATDQERLDSFAKSLIGMEFMFRQYADLEIIVKDKKIECLLPIEYFGKKDIAPVEEVRSENVTLE